MKVLSDYDIILLTISPFMNNNILFYFHPSNYGTVKDETNLTLFGPL